MRVADLDYDHPEDACAQQPAAARDQARLLVCRRDGSLEDSFVHELPAHVVEGDVFVVNDSRVQPARIDAAKDSGGRAELLILQAHAAGGWLAMIKASHAPKPGRLLSLPGGTVLEVLRREGDLFVLAEREGRLAEALSAHGRPPLPPYIRREATPEDVHRYQTLHARESSEWGSASSSVAAPTAGLHFTPELMKRMEEAGATFARVSLGVGPGTFRPIESQSVEDHRMHEEPIEVGEDAARIVNEALQRGRRVTAVGTTSLRALEAAATAGGRVRALRGSTGLYCIPGSRFRTATRLMTNFHRPQSTLLALVAAFAGRDRALMLHREGVARGYRLFSYGDATLIDRAS